MRFCALMDTSGVAKVGRGHLRDSSHSSISGRTGVPAVNRLRNHSIQQGRLGGQVRPQVVLHQPLIRTELGAGTGGGSDCLRMTSSLDGLLLMCSASIHILRSPV